MVSRMSSNDATAGTRDLPLSDAAARRCGLGRLRHVAVTGSTNDDLASEARHGDATPALLVADHQTSGRGRRDRRWEDGGDGGLLFSVRLPVGPEAGLGVAACLAASAVAVAGSVCPVPVRNKWPNDLVVEAGAAPGKLGGMLSELVVGPSTAVIVGLGINLEPVPDQPFATSIRQCEGLPDRDRLLAMIIDGFARRRDGVDAARAELRASSATIGRRVRVDLGSSSFVGTAADVTDDGRLIVATSDGERIVSAGEVVHLRPADGHEVD